MGGVLMNDKDVWPASPILQLQPRLLLFKEGLAVVVTCVGPNLHFVHVISANVNDPTTDDNGPMLSSPLHQLISRIPILCPFDAVVEVHFILFCRVHIAAKLEHFALKGH